MADVFITYKSERRPAVRYLQKVLALYGYSAWYDYGLVPGDDFEPRLMSELHSAKVCVVLWCGLSVRSEWVLKEAREARRLGSYLPVWIEKCPLPPEFAGADTIDLSQWDGAPRSDVLDRLIADIGRRIGRAPTSDFGEVRQLHEDWVSFGRPSLATFVLGARPLKPDEEKATALIRAQSSAKRLRRAAPFLIGAVVVALGLGVREMLLLENALSNTQNPTGVGSPPEPTSSSRLTVDDDATNSRPIASNDPQRGNVWHSLAQTFTAQDELVRFGFRLKDESASLPNAGTPIVYNLYAGENSYSNLLTSKTVRLPGTLSRGDERNKFGDVGFVFADFSNVALIVGQPYTVEITVPNLPGAASSTPISAWTSLRDPYRDGRFYFPVASPASTNNESFARDDVLFEVVRSGIASYEINMRLSDGGTVTGYFKFDSDAAMAAQGSSGDRFTAGLVDYDIKVSGGNTATFPELQYTPGNSTRSVIGRDDGPGFPIYAFGLAHTDAESEGHLLAIRWTTPQALPTKTGSVVSLTTWGQNSFGLANQQCFDCFPQRQGVLGSLRVMAPKPATNPN